MSFFYLCTELGCNKKYKTQDKFINHLLESHQITNPIIANPVEITKDNKKAIETNRNNGKKQEQREQMIKEIEDKKQLEQLAKKEAEDRYKEEQIQHYRQLEQEKLKNDAEKVRLDGEKLRLEQSHIEMMIHVQQNFQKEQNNHEDCLICTEKPAEMALVPCGHKIFCQGCVLDYMNKYIHKGCPFCRMHIQSVVKIYS